MTIGLVGRKCGMTRIFQEDGSSVPVTVIEIEPNTITQIKTVVTDGYDAIQVTTGKARANRITKPLAGHFAKANVNAGRGLWEFRLDDQKNKELFGDLELKVGVELNVDLFNEGQLIDVKSVSKGKGFAGTLKRYNFSHQDYTHGNSLSHRAPGSIGQNQSPGHVFKGKKMAGHMGDDNCSVQSQPIVKIDIEKNLVMIKGAVPGAPGGSVIVLPAVKAKVRKESK